MMIRVKWRRESNGRGAVWYELIAANTVLATFKIFDGKIQYAWRQWDNMQIYVGRTLAETKRLVEKALGVR